jgi:26S proteasome regulatory subunit N7
MLPFYKVLSEQFKWEADAALVSALQSDNESVLKGLEERIKDAEENLGETEIREALLAKAEFFSIKGDKVRDGVVLVVFAVFVAFGVNVLAFRLFFLFLFVPLCSSCSSCSFFCLFPLPSLLSLPFFFMFTHWSLPIASFFTNDTIDHFLTIFFDQDNAVSSYRQTYDKTVALGQRLDIVLSLIRIGLFWKDDELITRNIEKARTLVEEGGDWDRRNRLKTYECVYLMSIRDFKKAAELFLETLATFTSYELCDYRTFIYYLILMAMISLDRVTIKNKVIDSPDILSVIHEIPHASDFLNSFYNSDYALLFVSLAAITENIKTDRYLATHVRFYCREMRIKAYSQLLESYSSVKLSSMAEAFGVTVEFIDHELSRFIAAGRIHCKIDKVGGIVETTRPDAKNAQYQATIKQGDLLLNRIQKLSRVINL